MEDTTEYETLKLELLEYYRVAFSSPTACHTLAVLPAEVDLIKRLICLVGGLECCEVMRESWNTARERYPKMLLITELDFPTRREGWNRRG